MQINIFYPAGISALRKDDWYTERLKLAKAHREDYQRRLKLRKDTSEKILRLNQRGY